MNRQLALNILELNDNVNDNDIKKQYRKLALKYHPDKTEGGSDEKFKEINKAYEYLTNPQPEMNHPDLNSFFNPFDNIFFQQQGPLKCNNDIHQIHLNLRDVHKETVKKFKISIKKTCFLCKKKCELCNGSGKITVHRQIGPMTQIIQNKCTCNSGYVKKTSCDKCNLNDLIYNEIVEVKIPECTENNTNIIFYGLGKQPENEKDIPGDLIFNIQVKNNDIYFTRRNKFDLIHSINITLKESLIGKEIELPIYDNSIKINIKTLGIINPYKEYIFPNMGLGGQGNLILKCTIIYPELTFTDEQIQKLHNILDIINL